MLTSNTHIAYDVRVLLVLSVEDAIQGIRVQDVRGRQDEVSSVHK